MRARRSIIVAVAALGTIVMAGCTSSPEPEPPPTPSATADPTPTSSPTPTPTCGSMSPEEALAHAATEMPPPFEDPNMSDFAWTSEYGAIEGYDPCAELSWIVLSIEDPTASSPYGIALFTRGELIGPATEQAYGFSPAVERVDDVTLEVTYRWPQEGDTNAGPTGQSVAQFHLDEASGEIEMTGELPPQ